MNKFNVTRRSFLIGASVAGSTLAIPGLARAKSGGRVIVGTWGGDYNRLLKEEVAPVVANDGYRLVTDTGSATARKTKMITASKVGGGAMDVSCLSDSDMYHMHTQNVLRPISEMNIPNYENVFDQFKTDYNIPHIYSALVIVYDKSQVTTPPTSIADLWSDEYKGAVGFSDILFNYMLMGAAMAHGGNRDNFDIGKEALLELKKSGSGRVFPSNEAIANALESKEIKATLMWKARAFQWQNAGLPVAAVVPREGAIPVAFTAAATNFASNPDGAADVLNVMLDPEMQLKFADAMGYLPTVSNAPISDEMREKLGFTDAQRDAFVAPDFEYIAANLQDTITWWNQTYKA
ncbi:ABC transporter substrate-binding protein [Thalassospira lucentensis]|uniref:ABC transporter substrate-binding protein n=1 Tax=Thalassospira lucentensis TaxID=168935 RepID=UPI003AA85D20